MPFVGGEVVGSIALLDIGGGRAALRRMFVKAPLAGAGNTGLRQSCSGVVALIEWGGALQTTAIDVTMDRITAIYIIRNPDKRRHVLARVRR